MPATLAIRHATVLATATYPDPDATAEDPDATIDHHYTVEVAVGGRHVSVRRTGMGDPFVTVTAEPVAEADVFDTALAAVRRLTDLTAGA